MILDSTASRFDENARPDLWLFNHALLAVAAGFGIETSPAESPRTAAELASECGVLERPLCRMPGSLAGEFWATGP